ncbi:MAG: tyrosine-protein phosphatase [Leptolyngbya sp.]|nr:tyrosine-protein phosphatase [Candidatus Melainabacteria bacterium]
MSRLLTTFNIAAIIAATSCSLSTFSIGAQAVETPSPAKTRAEKALKPKEDLPNFHQVHPFLYRGGEPTREGLRKAKEMGVTTVLDLRNPGEMDFDEKELSKELGLKYIHMPMNSKAPTDKQVKKMMAEIDKAKEKSGGSDSPSKDAVFMHCAHGSDRTGCMIGIWRVKRDGYDYDKAYQEMRKYWFTPKFTNLSGAVRTAANENSSTKAN